MFKPFTNYPNIKLLFLVQFILFMFIWNFSKIPGIPNLFDIFNSWNQLALHQGLLVELFNSATTVLKALMISFVLSLSIASLSKSNFFLGFSNVVSALRFLGFTGLIYLFTIWTTDGAQLKLVLLVFGITVQMTTSMLAEVRNIPLSLEDYSRTLKLSGWGITKELFLKGKFRANLDILRQNAAVGWALLSMIEGLVRSEGGIGALLMNQNKNLLISAVLAIQLTIFCYGLFQDKIISFIIDIVCPKRSNVFTRYLSKTLRNI